MAGAVLPFVLGFTLVFLTAVVAVLGVADAVLRNELLLHCIGGVVTIAMGLVFLGLVPMLQRDVRLHRVPRGGIVAAPPMGAVYGLERSGNHATARAAGRAPAARRPPPWPWRRPPRRPVLPRR